MIKFVLSMAVIVALGIPEGMPDVLYDSRADVLDISGVERLAEKAVLDKYEELHNANSDMQGYIYLPENIKYPVMYTPYNQNYYINHDFNKAGSKEGLPFLNRYSLLGGQGISLIYGHHLKSGKGFTVLKHYLEDDGYLEENKYIQVDTLFNMQEYEVVAVALTSLNEPFNYYEYVGWMRNAKFNEWKKGFSEYVVRGSLSELTYEDVVLELSTCYYHKEDGRLVVILKEK